MYPKSDFRVVPEELRHFFFANVLAYYIDDFSLFGIISMLHFEKNRQIYEKEKPKVLVQSPF